ncbi:MAG TPA: amidohydrolase [Steroidobacteraceae bacterium]
MRPLLIVLALLPAVALAQAALFINGNVYTADEHNSRAQAIVSEAGHITYVGSNTGARQRAPKDARTIDLHGLTVFPGLTDSHAHLLDIGLRELSFNLEGTRSLAELKRRLRDHARDIKGGAWITGGGWIESRWTPPAFPTRSDLDQVVNDHPVVLERADGHALVANSIALERAGIDRNTPDPPGGRILKDDGGEPNGMLIDNAMERVTRLVPAPTDGEISRALQAGAERSVRLGWTQLQIAGNSFHEVDLICQLYARRLIQLRLYDAIYGPSEDARRLLSEGPTLDGCGGRITVRGIKLYIDGALGSRGAALLEPYTDAPDSKGLLVNDPARLEPILIAALKRGLQVETHAIGDRGNRIMLDLYEQAFATVPAAQRAVAQPRWRIEHAQILNPADIPRFARMGLRGVPGEGARQHRGGEDDGPDRILRRPDEDPRAADPQSSRRHDGHRGRDALPGALAEGVTTAPGGRRPAPAYAVISRLRLDSSGGSTNAPPGHPARRGPGGSLESQPPARLPPFSSAS